MSTVTSADGTVIDYDRYGDGPAVIFIGGAATYRAIDEATSQTARRLAAEGSQASTTTGADADDPATPSRGRWPARSRTSPR
jgi:hypothetical protein